MGLRVLGLLLFVLLGWASSHPIPGKNSFNKLLLISFDGFRWDYDQDVDTPNMDRLAREGVKAKYLTPPFVTMTSPSHFTTISGKFHSAVSPLTLVEGPGICHSLREGPFWLSSGETEAAHVTWGTPWKKHSDPWALRAVSRNPWATEP